MEQKTNRFYALLPWIITFGVLGAFTIYSSVYKVDYNPFEIKSVKGNLLSSMRIHLLEAIESEKNAVMAITDEESEAYAAKARQASDSVENSRKEIESIIHTYNANPSSLMAALETLSSLPGKKSWS